MLALTVACGAEEPLSDSSAPDSRVGVSTQASTGPDEPEEEEASEAVCVIVPTEDPVSILFSQLQETGLAKLGEGAPLELAFNLHPSRDIASLVISFEAETEFEEKTLDFEPIATAPGERETVEIDLDALGLSRDPLNFSGNLTVSATVLRPDGEIESTITTGASFHSSEDTWFIYDEDVKASEFSGGRLSESALAIAPPPDVDGSVQVYTFAKGEKISDSTDVPVVDEEEGSGEGEAE